MSELPYHIVVGMPALSPTMESGTLGEWKIPEGGEFTAGDSIAEIQTDKATIDFEAQDDGYIAKHLVQAGTEAKVGEPIMVTVEEEEYVKSFENFVAEAAAPAPAAAEAVVKDEVPDAPPPPPPPPPPAAADAVVKEVAPKDPAPPTVAGPTTPPTEAPAPTPELPAAAATVADVASPVAPSWGQLARTASPLAKTLSAAHKKYIETYGSSGQIPL